MENVSLGQFECHSDCKDTYTVSVGYCFSAPLKICYANEYMLVFDLSIRAKVSKAVCPPNVMGHEGRYEERVNSELCRGDSAL